MCRKDSLSLLFVTVESSQAAHVANAVAFVIEILIEIFNKMFIRNCRIVKTEKSFNWL